MSSAKTSRGLTLSSGWSVASASISAGNVS
jgi:hypothetical protein